MKIAVIGAGAMGGLFASKLSTKNEVTVIDLNKPLIEKVRRDGFTLIEPDGTSRVHRMNAAEGSAGMPEQDLVILFVKAMFSEAALEANRPIIGKNTFVLTLQNGMGHEKTIGKFADEDHAVLGTTQHNAAVKEPGVNMHRGVGPTAICNLSRKTALCEPIAAALSDAGIETTVSSDVRKMIWNKIFTNISASVLTGVLQVPLGFIAENAHARSICEALVKEAAAVAAADGFDFDYGQKIEEVMKVCANSPQGLTSIYADLKNGNRTEVDTISGAVLELAVKYGVAAPHTRLVVDMVHAIEAKNRMKPAAT